MFSSKLQSVIGFQDYVNLPNLHPYLYGYWCFYFLPRITLINTNSTDFRINYTNIYLPLAGSWHIMTFQLVLISGIASPIRYCSGRGYFILSERTVILNSFLRLF